MNGTITLPRSVVEQTIEAMRRFGEQRGSTATEFNAIEALRAALDQPQGDQEPVAWIENIGGGVSYNPYHEAARKLPDGVRFDLYTRPHPKREPLTDEEIRKIGNSLSEEHRFHSRMFARAIERAVWEKSNG